MYLSAPDYQLWGKYSCLRVIGIESHLGCCLSDLNAIFKVNGECPSSKLSSLQWQNSLVNTAKADRNQLPGRDENLTFTQLEQREWLKFTETLNGFVRTFYLLCRSSKTINPWLTRILYSSLWCGTYFFSHLELYWSHSHNFIQCVWGIPILPFRYLTMITWKWIRHFNINYFKQT